MRFLKCIRNNIYYVINTDNLRIEKYTDISKLDIKNKDMSIIFQPEFKLQYNDTELVYYVSRDKKAILLWFRGYSYKIVIDTTRLSVNDELVDIVEGTLTCFYYHHRRLIIQFRYFSIDITNTKAIIGNKGISGIPCSKEVFKREVLKLCFT